MHWIRVSILAVLTCVCGVLLGGVDTAASDDQGVVERETLECGLEVVVFSQRGMEGETQVWVRLHRGSMSERDDERGAAMMAARGAMFGVGDFSQERMFELFDVDENGAVAGDTVMVMGDSVAFMLEVGSADEVGVGFELARGLVGGFAPGDEAIERARGGMLADIDQIEDGQIERELSRRWLPALVDGSGYSRLPLASREQCEGLDADVVRGYVAREWSAGQASVLVVGDVDASEVIAEARRVFDGCRSGGETVACGVPIIKPDLGGRVVSINDVRLDGSRLGLVWFDEEREIEWDDAGLQEILVLALAGEAMGHRMNRLMRREFEGVELGRVDVGELLGRFWYGQIVVELKGDSGAQWERVLGMMEIERRRLVRDGLSEGEVERAREWLIQQWGYEIDQWRGNTTAERARALSFMLSSGRPLIDLVEWVDLAGVLLVDVDVERVNGAVQALFGEREPAVLVLIDSEVEVGEGTVRAVLAEARGVEFGMLDEDWLADLDGPILDRSVERGIVEEISVHRASGVVTAELGNGVVVHHREMLDADGVGGVVMVVRVGFDSMETAAMHGAGNVFAAAIEGGMIRSQTEKEIRGVLSEEGIEIEVSMGSWGIEVGIEVSSGSFGRGVELVHALLTDLRIEQGLVDEVAGEGESGALMIGVPVGAMEAGIGRAYGEAFVVQDLGALGEDVDARSVREWIDERVHGGAIEVGIAGEIDAEGAIEACALYFGGIEEGDERSVGEAVIVEGVGGEDTVRVRDASGREGVMVGFGGGMAYGDEAAIDEVRGLTVAGFVLEDRLKSLAGEGDRVMGGSMVLDVVPGRMVIFARVDCLPGEIDHWGGVIGDEIERLAELGVDDAELRAPLQMIDGVLEKNFERPAFWASRLARLGRFGSGLSGGVESIWSIREGYHGIDAGAVQGVFEKWYREGVHFRVEFVDEEQ